MKKLLLSFICLLALGLPALAESVTITMESQGWSDGQSVSSFSNDQMTISTIGGKYYNSGKALRLYNGNTLSVNPATGVTISKIDFELTTSGYNNFSKVSAGSISKSGSSATWTGSQTEKFTFTNGSTQTRIVKMTVTYSSTGSSTEKTAKPTISGTSPFEEYTTVTINGIGDIYYTLDGSSPTIGSTKYTAPFKLENSAVVKAIAKEANKDASDIAEMSFKKSSSSNSVYYQQVKSTDELSENDIYVIAYDNNDGTGRAISTEVKENNRPATTVNISDNILTATEETLLITLEKNGDSWKLCGTNYLGSNKYFLFNQNGGTNIKMTDASSATTASISFSTSGNVRIRNNASGESRYIKYNGSSDFRYYSDNSSNIKLYKQIELAKKETVTLAWGEAEAEYTVGQEDVTVELSAEPAEALESVVVTSSNPAVTVDYTTVPGLVALTFNEACDNVTLTAAIPENNEKYTAESKSISFAVKAPVVVPTPEEIVATPALNEANEVTVKKGETVTFSSRNASKLSVSVYGETATLENNPFVYTVTEETMLEIIPVDAEGKVYNDLKKEITIYVDETVEPEPSRTTSTVTFDFVKEDHLLSSYNSGNLNFRSKDLGLIDCSVYIADSYTGSFKYSEGYGWQYIIDQNVGTYYYFYFMFNDEYEHDYKLAKVKFNGSFDDNTEFSFNNEALANSTWEGLEDYLTIDAYSIDNFTISSIDVTFEHDAVKMPDLFGQDGKLGLSHRDGHDIYYKVVTESTQTRTVNMDPEYDADFKPYTEPFFLRNGETLYTYAQHPHGMVSQILRRTYDEIATGVENLTIDAANAEVKYFNLQGVEVENPAEGIYIRVANGKAEKIIK